MYQCRIPKSPPKIDGTTINAIREIAHIAKALNKVENDGNPNMNISNIFSLAVNVE